jgi:hypothetical protein
VLVAGVVTVGVVFGTHRYPTPSLGDLPGN